MQNPFRGDPWLGLFCVALAAAIAFIWIPLDVESGLIVKQRRAVNLGDALGPVIACAVIGLGGFLVALQRTGQVQKLSLANLRWMALLVGSIGLGLALMRWSGPALTALFTDTPYRALRTSFPWSYIGYLLGGTVMTATLITLASGGFHRRFVVIGFLATLVIALLYDLPFEDILLPPNGDL